MWTESMLLLTGVPLMMRWQEMSHRQHLRTHCVTSLDTSHMGLVSVHGFIGSLVIRLRITTASSGSSCHCSTATRQRLMLNVLSKLTSNTTRYIWRFPGLEIQIVN